MPTYEYGCEACGSTWEREQRITESPIKECPSCGKAEAKRLISGGTFMLKGGGWYADLYSGSSNKKSSGSESSSSSDKSSSSTPASTASSGASDA